MTGRDSRVGDPANRGAARGQLSHHRRAGEELRTGAAVARHFRGDRLGDRGRPRVAQGRQAVERRAAVERGHCHVPVYRPRPAEELEPVLGHERSLGVPHQVDPARVRRSEHAAHEGAELGRAALDRNDATHVPPPGIDPVGEREDAVAARGQQWRQVAPVLAHRGAKAVDENDGVWMRGRVGEARLSASRWARDPYSHADDEECDEALHQLPRASRIAEADAPGSSRLGLGPGQYAAGVSVAPLLLEVIRMPVDELVVLRSAR